MSVNTSLILNGKAVEASASEINLLSGLSSNVQDQIDTKQNTLTAGTNVTIQDGVISALTDLEGNLTGNVIGSLQGNVTGDVEGNLTGNVIGSLQGNVTGDEGNLTEGEGNLTGDVRGNLYGNVIGSLQGNVTGDVEGNVTGDLEGNVTGDVEGNVTGDEGNLTGDVEGNLSGDVTGNINATSLSLNNKSINVSSDEINNLSGITSNIQEQLDNKQGTLKAGDGIRLDEYGFISTLTAGITEIGDLSDVYTNSNSMIVGSQPVVENLDGVTAFGYNALLVILTDHLIQHLVLVLYQTQVVLIML